MPTSRLSRSSTTSRRIWCSSMSPVASNTSWSSKTWTTFAVITSPTQVPHGSQAWAVARVVMSRSVIMPTSLSLSPHTGSAPTFSSLIRSAARAMLSVGRTHWTPRVMTSFTCMAVSFRVPNRLRSVGTRVLQTTLQSSCRRILPHLRQRRLPAHELHEKLYPRFRRVESEVVHGNPEATGGGQAEHPEGPGRLANADADAAARPVGGESWLQRSAETS